MVNNKRILEGKETEIIQKYNAGTSGYKLAKEYGVSTPTVLDLLKKFVPDIKIRRRREKTLSKDKLEKGILSGKSEVALAKEFNVCASTIRKTMHDYWGHEEYAVIRHKLREKQASEFKITKIEFGVIQ